jgi:hypothetical protein
LDTQAKIVSAQGAADRSMAIIDETLQISDSAWLRNLWI